MKKKLFAIPFIILSFVLIFVGCAKGPKTGTNTEEYQFYYESPAVNIPDEGIAVDGSIDDAKWQDKSWMSFTRGGVTVKSTSFFGEEGLYVAMDVDCEGVYYAADWMSQYNSLCEINVTAVENTGRTWTNALRSTIQATAKYSIVSGDPVRHAAKATVKGELNTRSSTGMIAEFYVPWKQMGIDAKPEKVKIYPTYKRTYSATIASSRSMWIAPGRVCVPSTFYEFDTNGYLESDPANAVMGMSVDGMEKTGGWSYDHENGKYTVVENDNQWLFFKNAKATNYHIKATMNIFGGIDDGGSKAGLMLGYNAEKDTFVSVLLNTANGYLTADRVVLNKLVNTTTSWQISGTSFHNSLGVYDLAEPVTLQVFKVDGNVWIMINDDVVYSGIIDEAVGAITPGLYSVSCGMEYSDCSFTSYDEDVNALYTALGQYTNIVFTSSSAGGQVVASSGCVTDGEHLDLSFIANEGYILDTVTINGADVTNDVKAAISGGNINTAAITALAGGITENITVAATYKEIPAADLKTVSGKFVGHGGAKFKEKLTVKMIGINANNVAYYTATINVDGEFTFKLPKGEYRIEAYVDYYNWSYKANHTIGDSDIAGITLEFNNELSHVVVNATPVLNDTLAFGSQNFKYGQGYAYNENPGNHNTYIANSIGTVQVVSADLSLITAPSDPDPSLGFNFDNSGNAVKEGFNVLFYRKGIRTSVIGQFSTTRKDAGDLGAPVSVHDSVGHPVNLTVVRDNTTYYIFINGTYSGTINADYVEGDAAISLMTGGCTAKFANIFVSTDAEYIRNEYLTKVNPTVYTDTAADPDVEYKANSTVTIGDNEYTGNTVVYETGDGAVATPSPAGFTSSVISTTAISNTVADAHKITLSIEYVRSTTDYDPSAGVVFVDGEGNGAVVVYWQTGIRTFDLNNYKGTARSQQQGFDRFVTFDEDKNVTAHGSVTLTIVHYEQDIYVFDTLGRLLVTDTTEANALSAIALMTSGAAAKFEISEISKDKTAIAAFINNALTPGEGMTAVNKTVEIGEGDDQISVSGNVTFSYDNAEKAAIGSRLGNRGEVLYSIIDAPVAENHMVTYTTKLMLKGADTDPTAGLIFVDGSGDRTIAASWQKGVRIYRMSNPNGALGGMVNGGAMLGDFRSYAEITLTVVRTGNEIRIFDANDILISRYTIEDYLSGDAAVGFAYIGCVASFADYTVTTDATAINTYLSAHDHDNALATVSAIIKDADQKTVVITGNHPFAYGSDSDNYWYESVAENGYTDVNNRGVLENSVGVNQMASATITYLGKEKKDANGVDGDPSAGFAIMDTSSVTDGVSLVWWKKGIRLLTWKTGESFNASNGSLGFADIDGGVDDEGKVTDGASLKLTIVRKGSSFYVFVNDVLATQGVYDRYATLNAAVAFMSNGCYARFENYTVTTSETAIDAYLENRVSTEINASFNINDTTVTGNQLFGADKANGTITGGSPDAGAERYTLFADGLTTDGYQLVKFNVTKPVSTNESSPLIGVAYADDKGAFYNGWINAGYRSFVKGNYATTYDTLNPETNSLVEYDQNTEEQSLIFARKGNDYYVYRLVDGKYTLQYYRHYEAVGDKAALGLLTVGNIAEVSEVEIIVGKNAVNAYLATNAIFELNGTSATVTGAVSGAGDHELLVLPSSYGATQMVSATVKNTDNTNDNYPSYGVSFVKNQKAWQEGLTIVRYDDGFRTKVNNNADLTHTAFDLVYTKDKATENLTFIRKNNLLYVFVDDVLYFVYDASSSTTTDAAIALYSGGCKTEWTDISYTAAADEVDTYLAQYGTKTTDGANGNPIVDGTTFTSNEPWKVGTNGAGKTFVEGNKRGSSAQSWMYLADSVSTDQVITVTISNADNVSTRGTDGGATVGVVFSNKNDARYGAAILLNTIENYDGRLQFKRCVGDDGQSTWSNALYSRSYTGAHEGGNAADDSIVLTVARLGNTFYVFINGEHILTEEEYPLDLGEAAVGFIGYGASAQFSDWSLIKGETEVKAYLAAAGTDGYFVNSQYRNEADSANYQGSRVWKYTVDGDDYYVSSADTVVHNDTTYLNNSEGTQSAVTVTLDFAAEGTKDGKEIAADRSNVEGDPLAGVIWANEKNQSVVIGRLNNGIRVLEFGSGTLNKITGWVTGAPMSSDYGVATNAEERMTFVRNGNDFFVFTSDGKMYLNYTASFDLGKAAVGFIAINNVTNFKNYEVVTGSAVEDIINSHTNGSNVYVNATGLVGSQMLAASAPYLYNADGSVQNAAAGNSWTYLNGSTGTVQMVSADIQLLGLTAGEMDPTLGFAFSKVRSARDATGAYTVAMKRDGLRFAAADGTTAKTGKSAWTAATGGGTIVEHTSSLVSLTTYTDVTDDSITSGTAKTTISEDGKTATRISYSSSGERTRTNIVKDDVVIKFMAIRNGTKVYAFVHNGTSYQLVGAASYDNLTGDAMIALWTGGTKVKYSNLAFNTNEEEVLALLDQYNAPSVVVNAVMTNTTGYYGNSSYIYNADGSVQNQSVGNTYSYLADSLGTVQMVTADVKMVARTTDTTPSIGFTFSTVANGRSTNSFGVLIFKSGVRLASAAAWNSKKEITSDLVNGKYMDASNNVLDNTFKLRAVRHNTNFYAYIWNGTDWTFIGTTAYANVSGDAMIAVSSWGNISRFANIEFTTDATTVESFLTSTGQVFTA